MKLTNRCSSDIVIDTNVLSHADNPGSEHQEGAKRLLDWMRESEAKWVLDDNGKNKPNPQTSLLFAEYRRTLPPGGAGINLLTFCLASQRVTFADRPPEKIRNEIRKLIPRNRQDQVVVGATVGSVDRFLASNDYGDFTPNVRKKLLKKLSVEIVGVDEMEF